LRDSTSGYSAGALFAFPDLIGSATVSLNGSYYTYAGSSGITATPSVEYQFGGARMRAGYQFFRTDGGAYTVTSHGADLRWSQYLSNRVNWVVQVNARTGHNLRSTSAYSSLEVRF
jgi:hypothetical protein